MGILWIMPRRASSKTSPEEEGIATGLASVEELIGGPLVPKPKNRHAQALSKLGASKGGKARAAKLSAAKRKAIAKKAAAARWARVE